MAQVYVSYDEDGVVSKLRDSRSPGHLAHLPCPPTHHGTVSDDEIMTYTSATCDV